MSEIHLPANKNVGKFLNALETRAFRRGDIISFPEVRRVLSWYRFRKENLEDLFNEFKRLGLIEIVPYHGIRLLKDYREKVEGCDNESL